MNYEKVEELKQWLRARGRAFSEAAPLFGLPSPKGLLLVGGPQAHVHSE